MADMKKALAQWDAADELLAEKIEKNETDVVTQKINGYLIIRKHGRTVTVNGYITGINFTGSGSVTIGIINENLRPKEVIRTLCNCGANAYSVGTLGYMAISNDTGEIKVSTSYTNASGAVYVSCAYTI